VFVLMSLIICSNTVFGQANIEKGATEIGGNLFFISSSLSYQGHSDGSVSFFLLAPRFGFFKTDNFEVEPQLLYGRVSENPEYGSSYSFSACGGILSFSYNFKTSSNIVPFLFAGVGFLSYSGGGDSQLSAIAPDAGIGMKSFISDKGALRLELFYQNMANYMGIEDLLASNFGFRGGFSVFLK
ncbi:MAG TPA: hypothetical protein VGB16_00805, partial [candidate division Zixibacteria bacterium]